MLNPGIKLVVFKAPDATDADAAEGMQVLQALEEPRRQGDLIAYVVANPVLENVEHTKLILDASEYKIGEQDAVELYWRDDPAQPMPPSIQVLFTGKKN